MPGESDPCTVTWEPRIPDSVQGSSEMVLILPRAMRLASLTLMGKTDVGKEIVFPD